MNFRDTNIQSLAPSSSKLSCSLGRCAHFSPRQRENFPKVPCIFPRSCYRRASLVVSTQQPARVAGNWYKMHFLSTLEVDVRQGHFHFCTHDFYLDMTPWEDGLSHGNLFKNQIQTFLHSVCVIFITLNQNEYADPSL